MNRPTRAPVPEQIAVLPRIDLSAGATRDQDAEVIVVTDLHFGALDHFDAQWQEDKRYILSRDPATTRVLCLGDLTQMDTRYQRHTGVYQQSLTPDEQIDYAVREMSDIKGYVDLILAGNHDNRVSAEVGIDATKQIAARAGLAARYVRDNAVVSYAVGVARDSHTREGKPRPIVYSLYCYHGESVTNAGRNSLLRAVQKVPACDVYLSGHKHYRDSLSVVGHIYDPRTNTLLPRRRLVVACPSYQLGAGWAQRKNFLDGDWGLSRLVLATGERLVESVV